MTTEKEDLPSSGGEEDDVGTTSVDAKTLANRKKKEKKKAKQKAAAEPASAPIASVSGKKAIPAAARAAAERLELVKKMEDERKRKEEEERVRREEEERKAREAEEAAAALAMKKKEAKDAKKERLRAEGKLLSKSERERRAKADIIRKQLEEAGLIQGLKSTEETNQKKHYKKNKKIIQSANSNDLLERVASEFGQSNETAVCHQMNSSIVVGDWEKLLEGEHVDQSGRVPVVVTSENNSQVKIHTKKEEGHCNEKVTENEWEFPSKFRSPIVCVMGHVDAGKTKLLDKLRRTNVQEGEAGGITQQIGATFFPNRALLDPIDKVLQQKKSFEVQVPGLLVIDTPGHESFNNLRDRGSSLCDIAVLVVDILSGLETQTLESLEMLRKKNCPFVVALNKVDRLYSWKSPSASESGYKPIRDSFKQQKESVLSEFKDRWKRVHLAFAEKGINVALYWENRDARKDVSVVPTSAVTGEGIPDLLYTLIKLSQNLLTSRITYNPEETTCSVLEVKCIEGLGTTIDVVLINGRLKEGDRIVLSGQSGKAIKTNIRALLTPKPMREMRVKGEYIHHKEIKGAIGVKISAVGLEDAVAGTRLVVVRGNSREEEEEEERRAVDEVIRDFQSVTRGGEDAFSCHQALVEKEGGGIFVAASTLGSLEALLAFMKDSKIPVSHSSIGEVHRNDIRKAALIIEKKKEFGVVLAFDVKISAEARKEAEELEVVIFSADVIYHLFDQFTKYMNGIREAQKTSATNEAVFPCILKLLPECVFNKKDPIILGVDIQEGVLKIGTPLVAIGENVGGESGEPESLFLEVGIVVGIEKDKKPVNKASAGDAVAVKIQPRGGPGSSNSVTYGRQFDHTYRLVSSISRHSIDCLKSYFKDEMRKEDWLLIMKLKGIFKID